jgi:hypothetical protein
MNFQCVVHEPLGVVNNKYYIFLDLPPEVLDEVIRLHSSSTMTRPRVQSPLSGTVLKVKVQFRYNRIMCDVKGTKTLYEYKKGDFIKVSVKYCGKWEMGDYCGVSWVLNQVSEPTMEDRLLPQSDR